MTHRNHLRALPLALVLMAALLTLAACGGGSPRNQPPLASFSATPASGPAPLLVSFDASASSDPDGSVSAYQWDFGDGSAASGVSVQHSYGEGSFTVRLTVTDDRGATATAERTINVSAASTTGTLSGTVTPGFAGTAIENASWQLDESNLEFVPGELIVKLAPTLNAQAAALQVEGVRLERVHTVNVISAALYRSPNLSKAETLALAKALNARADVLYAHPNYILHPLTEPNDSYYGYQWHYPAINLPQAWEITTGSASTVVAVVDTGILFDGSNASLGHPDLAGRVLPGYDFITDPNTSGDGDGRDANAFDVGDEPGGQSSYHGSHVAGTIGAASNNGSGVAGVNWQAKILPVRVLGAGGGTLIDIFEGAMWAAGLAVDGVSANPNPASVINMSLGGQGSCPPAAQEILDAISARAIVVVAAGNENQNASNAMPASCAGVITVGATDYAGQRAPYSNYGSRIDVMAPGGDMGADLNGDQYADGVLSLGKDDNTGDFLYTFENGTSMAAPHVAGVVSLMKALSPDLGTAEALALLRATARPLDAAQCQRDSGSECGAGLIDAFAALQALQSGGGAPPAEGQLTIEPNPLDFGSNAAELSLTLTNTSNSSLTWEIVSFTEAPDNPGDIQEGAIYVPDGASLSGTIGAGASATTTLGIDRSRVSAPGFYQFSLAFEIDGTKQQSLTVRFSKSSDAAPSLSGPMIVAAFLDEGGELVLSGFQESDGVISAYRFEARPGENYVAAWSDENGSQEVDEGDYFGVYPQTVTVVAGRETAGVDFRLEQVVDAGALGLSSEQLRQLEQYLRAP